MRLPQQEQALKAEIDDSEEVWVRTLREREQQVVENCIKRDWIGMVSHDQLYKVQILHCAAKAV